MGVITISNDFEHDRHPKIELLVDVDGTLFCEKETFDYVDEDVENMAANWITLHDYRTRGMGHIIRALCEYLMIDYKNNFYSQNEYEQLISNEPGSPGYQQLPFIVDPRAEENMVFEDREFMQRREAESPLKRKLKNLIRYDQEDETVAAKGKELLSMRNEQNQVRDTWINLVQYIVGTHGCSGNSMANLDAPYGTKLTEKQ